MPGLPLVLVDSTRAEQFSLIGSQRGLFDQYHPRTDAAGITWAVKRWADHCLAATWLGPGWVFDPYAQRCRAMAHAASLEAMRAADRVQHLRELERAVDHLLLGPRAERVLWTVHRKLLEQKASTLLLADFELASTVWGSHPERWPRRWRKFLRETLEGLTWLHLSSFDGESAPLLGRDSALLTHSADLRGTANDTCPSYCPGLDGPHHHHYLVNVGCGFAGVLERFAQRDDASGTRCYDFPTGSSRSDGPSLWRAGKTGRLTQVYLPAKLGEPGACETITSSQHRLLQAIVRETTRKKRGRRNTPPGPEVIVGNQVADTRARGTLECPLLASGQSWIGFNGNKKRKGCGYKLTTPGGWLSKAAYPSTDVCRFLEDLRALSTPFGFHVVGLLPGLHTWYSLDQLQAMTSSPCGHRKLERIHLRIYTASDYLDRWTRIFGWGSTVQRARELDHPRLDFLAALSGERISKRSLADGIGMDRSLVCKILNGTRPCSQEFLSRAWEWFHAHNRRRSENLASLPQPFLSPPDSGVRDNAIAYLRRGWSIIPQVPGAKRPCVAWKPYQERPPTEKELLDWWLSWPNAGIAVVLGPASDLLVIDVDGEEAHQVLVNRLGTEPMAPKVLSGSGKPFRYHLFFRCPNLPTKAKATPWHPKLEFRGKGGVVIAPPSLHKSGNQYRWAVGQSLDEVSLSAAPAEIVEAIQRHQAPEPRTISQNISLEGTGEVSPSSREFLSGRWRDGPGWNSRLFRAAADLAGRRVPYDVAEPLLLAGARPWNESERDAARRTIHSAYSQPREPGRS